MKKNDFLQIKGLDIKELVLKIKALQKEIADLVLDKNMKKLKDLKQVSKKRKDLAQILTVLRTKELMQKVETEIKDKPVKQKKTDTGKSSSVSKTKKEVKTGLSKTKK